MHSVVVNDPRIDVTSELSQVITRGGQRLTQYTQSCDSTSTSQSNWSFQPKEGLQHLFDNVLLILSSML
jgi:hypothetical protein